VFSKILENQAEILQRVKQLENRINSKEDLKPGKENVLVPRGLRVIVIQICS